MSIQSAAPGNSPHDNPLPGLVDLPPIENAATVDYSKLEKPRELISGLLYQGDKMMIAAGSKSFKTWALIHLGLCASTGTEWLGHTIAPCRVLFANFELQPIFFHLRVIAIADVLGIPPLRLCNLDAWHLRGYATALDEMAAWIVDQAGADKYGLIILDPVYKGLGGRSENSNEDITGMLNAIERVAKQSGAAIVYSHHFSKGSQNTKAAIDRASGAGAFGRDPDAIMVMTPHEEEEALAVETILRNFAPAAPYVVRWRFPVFKRATDLDPGDLKKPGPKQKADWLAVARVLADAGPGGLTASDWRDNCKAQLCIGERTFYSRKAEIPPECIEKNGDKWKARLD